ncbi:ImmA/IrrE family metallo-endopeptidase [Microbulbifer sp. SSSA002]|uniref:ImmA/IrrE family metallo-endopeptidase n=1 Tax=Microbulbifer sp. SSSA002 TaxID=3243376 RepID=UPI0040396A8C
MAFARKDKPKIPAPVEFEDHSTPKELLHFAKEKGIDTDPINISDLAAALGIAVRYEPLADDQSGSLKKCPKTERWVMTINSLHHPHRQRFTIAHEIGHRIKHAEQQNDFSDKIFFRNGETNRIEVEANQFAAELLMPENSFRNYIKNNSAKVEDIAKYFKVSSMAVRYRAKKLGMSGHNL